MKKIYLALVLVTIISGCTSIPGRRDTALQGMGDAVIAERAALRFFKRGGFKKSSALFEEAADMYSKAGDRAAEKRALVAAAKAQLWAGKRDAFIQTVDAIKDLVGRYEFPDDDTATLINMANRMQGLPLSYPIIKGQEAIFD